MSSVSTQVGTPELKQESALAILVVFKAFHGLLELQGGIFKGPSILISISWFMYIKIPNKVLLDQILWATDLVHFAGDKIEAWEG